jgi:hypothetical protein
MGDIEDFGSASLVKVQDTKNCKSRSVIDFTNIIEISSTINITREVGIAGVNLKIVTAGKKN